MRFTSPRPIVYKLTGLAGIIQLGGFGENKIGIQEVAINARRRLHDPPIARVVTIKLSKYEGFDGVKLKGASEFAAWLNKRNSVEVAGSARLKAIHDTREELSVADWGDTSVEIEKQQHPLKRLVMDEWQCLAGKTGAAWVIIICANNLSWGLEQIPNPQEFIKKCRADSEYFMNI